MAVRCSGIIAPTTALASTFGMQATEGQQFIDVCDGILLGSMCLIEPERAECIEGIGIKIRERFPLLPDAFGPRFAFFRQQVGLAIDEKGAELGHAASHISGEKSGGPGDSIEALEGIEGEGFPDSLIMRGTENSHMLVSQERDEAGTGGVAARNPSRCSSSARDAPRVSIAAARSTAICWARRARHWWTRSRNARGQGDSRLEHSRLEDRIWHRRQSVFAMLLCERLECSSDKVDGHTPCHSAPATGIVARSELLGEGSAHHLNSCGAPRQLDRTMAAVVICSSGRAAGIRASRPCMMTTFRSDDGRVQASAEPVQWRSGAHTTPYRRRPTRGELYHCELFFDGLKTLKYVERGRKDRRRLGGHAFSFTSFTISVRACGICPPTALTMTAHQATARALDRFPASSMRYNKIS